MLSKALSRLVCTRSSLVANVGSRHVAAQVRAPDPKPPFSVLLQQEAFQQDDSIVTRENDYIYKHLNKYIFDTFSGVKEHAAKLPVYPKVQELHKLAKRLQILNSSHRRYPLEVETLFLQIKTGIQFMNQLELASLLTAIKDYDSRELKVVKRMIDIELRWLLKEHVKTRLMDLDLWLYLANVFYESRMKSKFVQVLVNYLTSEKDVSLTNRQILHVLFLIMIRRENADRLLEKYESRIFDVLNRASLDDTALICLAYFKTKTIIKNPELLKRIIDRTTGHLSTLDPSQPAYCSIIKSVRYSRTPECRADVLHLVLSLTGDLDARVIFASPYNAVHTIKMMESFRIYEPNLLHLLRTTMFSSLEEFRIKDIQYALTSLSSFAYADLKLDASLERDFNKLSNLIVSETRRDVHHQYYHLFPLIRALASFGYYNKDLIDYSNQVLANPKKVEIMKDVLELEKSALLVYLGTMIEADFGLIFRNVLGNYHKFSSSIERYGNYGSVKQDSSLNHLDFLLRDRRTHSYYSNSNAVRKIATMLAKTEELRGPEYSINFQYTMPHQNYADLVLSKDRPAPGSFDQDNLLPGRVQPGERHCVLQACRRSDYIDGDSRLSGHRQFVARLLSKLGYTVLQFDMKDESSVEAVARKVKSILQ